jgi:hypothetical protein
MLGWACCMRSAPLMIFRPFSSANLHQGCLCVDQEVHRGFPCGRTCLRERFASPTSKPPTQLPTHFPFSSIVEPATPSTPGGARPDLLRDGSGNALPGSKPQPPGNSQVPSHGFRGWAILPDAGKTDSSKNIFRVGAAHLKEPASLGSTLLTNGSSAGSDFQLNGLPWRI